MTTNHSLFSHSYGKICLKDSEPFTSAPEIVPQIGDFLDVLVSVVDGYDSIYVQPIIYEPHIQDLVKKMNELYEDLDKEDLAVSHGFFSQSGGVCAALYQEDGAWYRARFLERKSPAKIEVQFIDYGNVSKMPLANVKKLLRKWVKIPQMAIRCSDSRLKNVDSNVLKEMLEGNTVVVSFDDIQDEKKEITIYKLTADMMNHTNVSEELAAAPELTKEEMVKLVTNE